MGWAQTRFKVVPHTVATGNLLEQVSAKKIVLTGTANDFVGAGEVVSNRGRIALFIVALLAIIFLLVVVNVYAGLTKEAQKQSQIAQEQSQIAQARANELKTLP